MRDATGERVGTVTLDGAPVAYELSGTGPAVVLVHAGIADRRMWDPQVAALSDRFTVVRYDLRGFGGSPDPDGAFSHHEQLLALIDALGLDEVRLVGCSVGAFVCLCAAVVAPERVRHQVLISPILDGVDPTPAVARSWRAETAALEVGDLDRAVAVTLRTWVDGPRRGPDDVDAVLRDTIAGMQADVLAHAHAGRERALEPGPGGRLSQIHVPTVLVTGTLDQRWIHDCADRLAAGLPDVRLHAVDGAAHLPNLEAPERVNALLLDVLAR